MKSFLNALAIVSTGMLISSFWLNPTNNWKIYLIIIYWYYSSISQALKRYTEETLAECDDVKSMLVRIDEVEKLIDSKF